MCPCRSVRVEHNEKIFVLSKLRSKNLAVLCAQVPFPLSVIVYLPLFFIRPVRGVDDLSMAPGTASISQTLINSSSTSLATAHALPSPDQLTNKVILSSALLLLQQYTLAEIGTEAVTTTKNSYGIAPEDQILQV